MRTARDVLTPWLCRKTMMSRTAFCSAQPEAILPARKSPIPGTSRSRLGSASMILENIEPELPDNSLGELASNPSHHAGAEIARDAIGSGGRRGFQHVRLELQAVR